MGIGDIGVSLWGECEHQDGMHLGARGFVHAELIDPETQRPIPLEDGASGELVLTHLRHRAAPLLRFRTRDHVRVKTSPCPCGRTGPRIRCIGRTDDMLIVRGVNVFPSAVREIVSAFAPDVSGHILVRPRAQGVKQDPPLPVSVELARDARADERLADSIRERLRDALVVQTRIDLVPWGTLQRSEYKVEARRARRRREADDVKKLQTQGVHHITLVGADRQTSIDFWEGVLGMPFVFEQPNLDRESESHLYFDPGDGRLITIFTNEDRTPDPDPHLDRHRRRPPHRVLGLPGDVRPGRHPPRRARDPPQRRQGPRLHGLDLLHRPARAADRALVLPLRAARRLQHGEVLLEAHKLRTERGDHHIDQEHLADAIEALVTRSRESLSTDRAPQGPVHPLGGAMAEHTLNILAPSVNNLTARIFVRAAGLDFEEVDVYGQTLSRSTSPSTPPT